MFLELRDLQLLIHQRLAALRADSPGRQEVISKKIQRLRDPSTPRQNAGSSPQKRQSHMPIVSFRNTRCARMGHVRKLTRVT